MAKATLYSPEITSRYISKGYWNPMNLSDYWIKNSKLYPDKIAVVDNRTKLTWAEASRYINRLALGFLETGLKKDDAVVIQLPNCVELPLLRMACERAGLLHIPVLRTFRHAEMEHIIRHTEARALVIPGKYRDFDYFAMIQELKAAFPSLVHTFVVGEEVPHNTISIRQMLLEPLENRFPVDYLERKKCTGMEVSLVGLTTGTTGLPKFVEIPACCWIWSANADSKALKLTGNDIVAALGPAPVGPNIAVYFGAPQVAAKIVMLEHWSVEEALHLIDKEKVTLPCVVPTQLAEMANYPHLNDYNLSSLRAIWCAGAPLPYHVAAEIEQHLQCPIVQAYGAMDFGGITHVYLDWPQEVRLLTVGFPHPGNEIKLTDADGNEMAKGETGIIQVRGPTGASGYYRDLEATFKSWDKEGWYNTGDLGKWDGEGHLMIVGREKDMIIRGGQNIYPLEVENLLVTHPKISSAAIIGIADPIMGERACACVVTKPGESFSFDEMVLFLKSKRIAAYKIPEKLMIIDSLPLIGGLKIDKKALKIEVAKKLQNQQH